MALFKRTDIRSMKKEIDELKLSNEKLVKTQSLIVDDILVATSALKTYRGNAYQGYETQVSAIDEKYRGIADWGVLQVGNIIDLRSSFIIGQGIKVVKTQEDGDREVAFVRDFLDYNNLDAEVIQQFATEAEIEGKILLRIAIDDLTKNPYPSRSDPAKPYTQMINVRFVSWTSKKYEVKTEDNDYLKYKTVEWTPPGKTQKETLKAPEFVYKKFGGRIDNPNEAQPKIAKCLTQVDNLDKALRDWREIDRLFSAPTPEIECKTAEEAEEMNEQITAHPNFKIKKFFAHTGSFSYKSPDMKGVEALENEILTLAKMISGTTGVPIQALGLADLLSNRSVADNLSDLIYNTTLKERETWIGALEELVDKAIAMYNDITAQGKSKQAKLDSSKVAIEIPYVSESQWLHLEKVLIPLVLAGKLSDEYILEQIPGLDIEAEKKRKAEKETSELTRLQEENERLTSEAVDRTLVAGEEKDESLSFRTRLPIGKS